MNDNQIEAVSRAICAACDENPDHKGDCRGNAFRWQDYREPAVAAIRALQSSQEGSGHELIIAGYTADNIESESRAFTVYRNKPDAEFEAKATGAPIRAIYRD